MKRFIVIFFVLCVAVPVFGQTKATIYLTADARDMWHQNGNEVDGNTRVPVGRDGGDPMYSCFAFRVGDEISEAAIIDSAKFTAYMYEVGEAGDATGNIKGYAYESVAVLEGNNVSGFTKGDSSEAYTFTLAVQSHTMDITSVFQEWSEDYAHVGNDWFGIEMQDDDDGDEWGRFYDASHSSYSNHTYIEVWYSTSAITPNPATFDSVPYAVGTQKMAMVANTALTGTAPFSYWFEETTGNSGATDTTTGNTSWVDRGLDPGSEYCYVVRIIDSTPETTDVSDTTCVTLDSLGADPATISETNFYSTTACSITATAGVNNVGTIYYFFEDTLDASNNSSWQTSNVYDCTGLSVNDQSCWRVRMHDDFDTTAWSAVSCGHTLAVVTGALSLSSATDSSFTISINLNGNPDSTKVAIYDTVTYRYLQGGATLLDTGVVWKTPTGWGTSISGLRERHYYVFKVKARNEDLVETAYSEVATALSVQLPSAPTFENVTTDSIGVIPATSGDTTDVVYAVLDSLWDVFLNTSGDTSSTETWKPMGDWGTVHAHDRTQETRYPFAVKGRCDATPAMVEGHNIDPDTFSCTTATQFPKAYYYEDSSYAAWYARDQHIHAAAYDHDTKRWSQSYQVSTSQFGSGDDHCSPAIHVIQYGVNAGKVLVMYSGHNTDIWTKRSTNVADISAWSNGGTINVDRAAYPKIVEMPDTTLWCFFRQSIIGGGWDGRTEMYNKSTDGGATWTGADDDTLIRVQNGSTYCILTARDDTMAIAFCKKIANPSSADVSHIYFLWSIDGGNSWEDIDGTTITLPANESECTQVYETPDTMMGSFVADIQLGSENGYPHILFNDSTDQQNVLLKEAEYNGTSWDFSLVCTTQWYGADNSFAGGRYDMSDPTLNRVFACRPTHTIDTSAITEVILFEKESGDWVEKLEITRNSTYDNFGPFSAVNASSESPVFWYGGGWYESPYDEWETYNMCAIIQYGVSNTIETFYGAYADTTTTEGVTTPDSDSAGHEGQNTTTNNKKKWWGH